MNDLIDPQQDAPMLTDELVEQELEKGETAAWLECAYALTDEATLWLLSED